MLADLPIFGIFGHHESGKTTLIEKLLPRLLARQLAVTVAKVHGSRIEVDRPGKDSDRLYQAGADVFMAGKAEGFARFHLGEGEALAPRLVDLARRYDLVLVEGRREIECERLWLLGEGEAAPPPEATGILAVLGRDIDRAEAAWAILDPWLSRRWLKTPVYGGVMIGGRSTRMGTPKHLLPCTGDAPGGETWVERTARLLRGATERVVILGAGAVPESLADLARLPDVPDARGPMAGLLAALRWAGHASWLVSACDLPGLRPEALAWLLSTRAPGVWATLPRLPGREGVEPLLAHYDFRSLAPLQALAAQGRFGPSLLAEHPKVLTPSPPADLAAAWENVNTPEDLARQAERSLKS